MFVLFEHYKAYKKIYKGIFDFIRYWLTIVTTALYVGFYYTFGLYAFSTLFFGVLMAGFFSTWFADFTILSIKFFRKHFKKKVVKK